MTTLQRDVENLDEVIDSSVPNGSTPTNRRSNPRQASADAKVRMQICMEKDLDAWKFAATELRNHKKKRKNCEKGDDLKGPKHHRRQIQRTKTKTARGRFDESNSASIHGKGDSFNECETMQQEEVCWPPMGAKDSSNPVSYNNPEYQNSKHLVSTIVSKRKTDAKLQGNASSSSHEDQQKLQPFQGVVDLQIEELSCRKYADTADPLEMSMEHQIDPASYQHGSDNEQDNEIETDEGKMRHAKTERAHGIKEKQPDSPIVSSKLSRRTKVPDYREDMQWELSSETIDSKAYTGQPNSRSDDLQGGHPKLTSSQGSIDMLIESPENPARVIHRQRKMKSNRKPKGQELERQSCALNGESIRSYFPDMADDRVMNVGDAYDEWTGLGAYKDIPMEGGVKAAMLAMPSMFTFQCQKSQRRFNGARYLMIAIDCLNVADRAEFARHLSLLSGNRKLVSIGDRRWIDVFFPLALERMGLDPAIYTSGRQRVAKKVVIKKQMDLPDLYTKNLLALRQIVSGIKAEVDLLHHDETMVYHDETAFATAIRSVDSELPPLPPPPEIPDIPNGLDISCEPGENRIIYVDFKNVPIGHLSKEAKAFIGFIMERDDLTVILRNLCDLDSIQKITSTVGLREVHGEKRYYFIRRYSREDRNASFEEIEGNVNMTLNDFFTYIDLKEQYSPEDHHSSRELRYFEFIEKKTDQVSGEVSDVKRIVDLENEVLYLYDLDVRSIFPEVATFRKSFKFPELLPGGEWCMMNKVAESGQPDLGPNFYMTPGGGFTQFHQDGHGTVDSGHLSVSGYNEVVMLRRMPECHKVNALKMLNVDNTSYDALYHKPHADGQGQLPRWATHDVFNKWTSMNYCPVALILQPGELLHINKGRLHAFRKLEAESLPLVDVHNSMRSKLVEETGMKTAPICRSIAWDWMFLGATAEGINKECAATLECAALNTQKGVKPIAIPETAILHIAKHLRSADSESHPSVTDVAKGLSPALSYIVKSSISDLETISDLSRSMPKHGRPSYEKLSIRGEPDTCENPDLSHCNPYGNDYFCKLCDKELSNVYLHCNGCERLLDKDFNICVVCYQGRAYAKNLRMCQCEGIHSVLHHIGDIGMVCKCFAPRMCPECNFCDSCQCRCHMSFECRVRFFTKQELESLPRKIASITRDQIKHHQLTEMRLAFAFNALPSEKKREALLKSDDKEDQSPIRIDVSHQDREKSLSLQDSQPIE